MNRAVLVIILLLSSCATVKSSFVVKSGRTSRILVDGKEACRTTPCEIELICKVGAISRQESVTNTNHDLTAVSKTGKESIEVNACTQASDEPILFFVESGPIYNEMSDPAFLTKYFKDVCGISNDAKKESIEQCNQKWNSSFLARLNVEYRFADAELVKTKCNAYPLECNPQQLERWAIESHQKRKAASIEKAQLEAKKQANFDSLLNSLQKSPQPVSCTTNKNGFGGFNTYCQ